MKILIKVILKMVLALINILLLPLNFICEANIVDISVAVNHVSNLLQWLVDFVAWVISWLPFSTGFYTFVIGAIIFIHITPLLANLLKIVVKWWHALVP